MAGPGWNCSGDVAAGAVTLTGCAGNFERLTDWDGDGISMFANTALASVLSGGGMVLLMKGHARVAAALGLLAGLIGAMTLFQHLTGLNLGIDTLLFPREFGNRASAAPLRMGPGASYMYLSKCLRLNSLSRPTCLWFRADGASGWMGVRSAGRPLVRPERRGSGADAGPLQSRSSSVTGAVAVPRRDLFLCWPRDRAGCQRLVARAGVMGQGRLPLNGCSPAIPRERSYQ
jgi:hypothetical protein